MLSIIKTFARRLLIGINIIVIALMALAGAADRINPESHPLLANAGFTLPVFIVINALFLIFWIIFSTRTAVVPVIGFILCYLPIRTYCPLNIKRDVPEGALKIVSLNVHNLDTAITPADEHHVHPAVTYLKEQDADIVCMQEGPVNDILIEYVNDTYPYVDSVRRGNYGSSVSVMSKYPIVKKERIVYESHGNMSGAFYIDIDGDTVVVVNNHFESSGLSADEREEAGSVVSRMMQGKDPRATMPTDTAGNVWKRLIVTLGESARKRAPQARAVAQYVQALGDRSIILCGDFNDSPVSYTRRTAGRGLTDCYVECGNGPGWTFNRGIMRVRIDNIMCSGRWEPCSCVIDRQADVSDHLPMICMLKRRDTK